MLRRCGVDLSRDRPKYFYLGPSGSGATMKLVVNTLLGIGMQAIAEAVALGEKARLDRIVCSTCCRRPPSLLLRMSENCRER